MLSFEGFFLIWFVFIFMIIAQRISWSIRLINRLRYILRRPNSLLLMGMCCNGGNCRSLLAYFSWNFLHDGHGNLVVELFYRCSCIHSLSCFFGLSMHIHHLDLLVGFLMLFFKHPLQLANADVRVCLCCWPKHLVCDRIFTWFRLLLLLLILFILARCLTWLRKAGCITM